MALSVFEDKNSPPSEAELRSALGSAAGLWTDVIGGVSGLASVEKVWGFTSKTTGWGLRLKADGRVIMYMTPCRGYFLASFALGEAPMAAARSLKVPRHIRDVLAGAKRYAEGYGVRFEVRERADAAAAVAIARLKLES